MAEFLRAYGVWIFAGLLLLLLLVRPGRGSCYGTERRKENSGKDKEPSERHGSGYH